LRFPRRRSLFERLDDLLRDSAGRPGRKSNHELAVNAIVTSAPGADEAARISAPRRARAGAVRRSSPTARHGTRYSFQSRFQFFRRRSRARRRASPRFHRQGVFVVLTRSSRTSTGGVVGHSGSVAVASPVSPPADWDDRRAAAACRWQGDARPLKRAG